MFIQGNTVGGLRAIFGSALKNEICKLLCKITSLIVNVLRCACTDPVLYLPARSIDVIRCSVCMLNNTIY